MPTSDAPRTVTPKSTTATTAAGDVWHKTACILCESNCGLEIKLEGRSLAKIRGDKDHPVSAGYSCEKPLRLDRYQSATSRLTSPLRRRPDGTYEEIDWDTAITEIAAKFSKIRDEHGGERIFYYSGAGQGNHLGAAYGQSLRAALGMKLYSNALAQEKTGEAWVDAQLYGTHTKGDFEHSEVVLFLGKNPWQSHSFPRARPTLKAIAADPARSIIVIDPRRSETAELADFHLQVKPGTDAWCLAAMLGVIVDEGLLDQQFLADHTSGVEDVLAALTAVPVADYADRCGVDEQLIRATAHRFATAASATTYEDLGIQQGPNSVLVSYLNKLLWLLTGNFGRPGTMYLHTWFVSLAGGGDNRETDTVQPLRRKSGAQKAATAAAAMATKHFATGLSRLTTAASSSPLPDLFVDVAAQRLVDRLAPIMGAAAASNAYPRAPRTTPVTGAKIVAGLIPCNSIADEILTDHPDRLRAMWIDSSNPAHSLPESSRFIAAMRALELTVVVDVAFTETARQADYVLPASTQYEKWEATFFNFEFPRNVFHPRAPLMAPLPGTLPEPEIYVRLLRALDSVDEQLLQRLRTSAETGRDAFALAYFSAAAADPSLLKQAAYVLHETLGTTLPEGQRPIALLWAASHLCAINNRDSVVRAGFTGPGLRPGEKLFDALLATATGVTFTVDEWDDVWQLVRRSDHRITIAVPTLLEQLRALPETRSRWTTDEYPFVLAAGERRSFTANTIIRDPEWRRRDRDGALRISPADASKLELTADDRVRVTTEGGTAETSIEITDMMQPGHVSLPNGMGIEYPDESGLPVVTGVAVNQLTVAKYRDPMVGTPWHKHVPARLERVAP